MSRLHALALIYDIRGFTAASRGLSATDLGAFAMGAHRTILDQFAAHPPSFVKNLGDGHLLLWEVEGDLDASLVQHVVQGAERARTGFVAWVAGQRSSGSRLPARVGIGVAFGEVHRSDDYYGRAINLASRLQDLARPEGVAMDTTVFAVAQAQRADLEQAFQRLRVRLRGLGRTWVWVARPFSLPRLVRKVAGWVAVALLPVVYVLLCDAGVALPGSQAVMDALDEREIFLLRPALPLGDIAAHAPLHRSRLVEQLHSLAQPSGFFRNSFDADEANDDSDVWSTMQAMAALLRAPELRPEHYPAVRRALDAPFAPGQYIEVDGVAFGWRAHSHLPYTEVEPALWTTIALALALGRTGVIEPQARAQAMTHLNLAQRAASTYRPLDTGGWNIFPRQVDPARHSPYSTALALLALLELKSAGLPWEGSVEARDRMLLRTAEFLIARFEAGEGGGGWRRTNDRSDKISAGLTLQIVAALLRAERDAGVQLSDALGRAIPGLLLRVRSASLSDAYDMGEFTVEFLSHENRRDGRTEGINFLWHPWAMEAATRWLLRPRSPDEAILDVVAVRRALAHWAVATADEAVRAASAGYCFVASETLFGWSALEQVRGVPRHGP